MTVPVPRGQGLSTSSQFRLNLGGWWAAPEWLRKTVAITLGLAVLIFLARSNKFADQWITLAGLIVVLYLVLHNAAFVGAVFDTLGRSIAGAATTH
jgi:hypothetical protein